MDKAFVFGKFLPFHKGHQAMIEFAMEHCDFLSVLVCASDKENIQAEIRKSWIEQTFKGNERLEVLVYNYNEDELTNSSISSREVSIQWAEVFKKIFPDHSLVITSEPYGDFVAEAMGIKHVVFDLMRTKVFCSSSFINEYLEKGWKFLPDAVKPYYVKKVVILGTESTGKSTLAKNLSEHFNATLVTEAGRELIDDSNEFTIGDLYKVAKAHAKHIENACQGESPLVIIDTDLNITQSYAQFVFGEKLDLDISICTTNLADLYLYLCNDVPYIQDGTRLNEEQRNLLDESHRKTLGDRDVSIIEIRGSWEERFEKAVKCIELMSRKDSL